MNKSKDIKPLLKIKKQSDIKSFSCYKEFDDDHQRCAYCKINDIKIEFWWYDDLACLYYWKDSKKAFKDLLSCIENEVYMAKNYELDYPEEA
jgi:hypothetical protein